jgi:hypothetical protein
MENKKKCPKCKEEKELAEFGKHKNRKDGLQSYCKKCNNKDSKNYRKKSNENGTCQKCSKPKLENSVYCLHHLVRNILKLRDYKLLTQIERDYYTEVMIEKLEDQNYKCYISGITLIPGINACIDHILPKKNYPELTLDLENLAWIDSLVNSVKNSHNLEDAKERWNNYTEQILEGYKYKNEHSII